MSLLNEASFLVTPNGYKEDKLYAAIPTNGNGDMTVSRATTATRVNEAGLVELVPYNLLSRSQEFNTSWSASLAATITPNATTAPDGTMTADSITTTPSALSYFSQSTTQPAGTYTLSFFVKPQVGIGRIYLELFTNNPGLHYFNLDLGVVVGSGDSTFTITPYPNGWYRCTATRTFASSILGTGAIYLAAYGSSATLTTIFFWGGQLVEGTSALTYQKTVDRLDIPRIDYTGGGCPSILLEPQRTNLLTYSEQFDNAAWSKTRCTITANSTNSPNGTLTADTLIGNSVAGENYIYLSQNATIGVPNVLSVYIKPIDITLVSLVSFTQAGRASFSLVGSGSVTFENGICTNSTIESLPNGWYRISTKITPTATASNYIGIATSSLGIVGNCFYIWGAQLEAGAYPTSYIPTTTATVTRNADLISKTGVSDLIGQTEGVLFVEMAALSDDGTFRSISLSNGTATNRVTVRYYTTSNSISAFVYQGSSTIFTYNNIVTDVKDFHKLAIKYKSGDLAFWVDGVEVATSTTSFTFLPLTKLNFDRGDGDRFFYGKVKQLQVYKTALTDTQLAALTT